MNAVSARVTVPSSFSFFFCSFRFVGFGRRKEEMTAKDDPSQKKQWKEESESNSHRPKEGERREEFTGYSTMMGGAIDMTTIRRRVLERRI